MTAHKYNGLDILNMIIHIKNRPEVPQALHFGIHFAHNAETCNQIY